MVILYVLIFPQTKFPVMGGIRAYKAGVLTSQKNELDLYVYLTLRLLKLCNGKIPILWLSGLLKSIIKRGHRNLSILKSSISNLNVKLSKKIKYF